MSGLLENIGNILTSIIIWLGQIANALIQNPIFTILMAVILFKLLYNLIRKIIDIINIEKMPYMNIDREEPIHFDAGTGGGDNRYDDLTEEEFMHEYTGL